MFVKTKDEHHWINLNTCDSVNITEYYIRNPNEVLSRTNRDKRYRIEIEKVLPYSPPPELVFFNVGDFATEDDAVEAVKAMWRAYRDGEKVWEVESSHDEGWTAERFNELVSESERRACYESRNGIEKLCELGANLMALVEREQWELTHRFTKNYFAFYFRRGLVFGVHLQRAPHLSVWKIPKDVLARWNDDLYDGQYPCRTYYDSNGRAGYPEHLTVEYIEKLLEFAYFYHAGLL